MENPDGKALERNVGTLPELYIRFSMRKKAFSLCKHAGISIQKQAMVNQYSMS